MVSAFTQEVIPIPPSTIPPQEVEVEEYTLAPYFCTGGCGGNNTDEYDITKYEFGECLSMENCE